jgi:hypothetical protein
MTFFILVAGILLYAQTDAFKIQIYDNSFNPHEHPDFSRKHVKPPNWELFNNRTQFITLRSLEGDFRKKLDDYTIKYDLGKVIWPSYTTLYLENIDTIVYEIKKRNLFLFDLWGYVPGSGPGGYWQQFYPPENVLSLFETELGDHWLGMDNGEQDGRYIGGFAKQLYPTGMDRKSQYFNFQNHFEALCDALGNKMATLVSLNFGPRDFPMLRYIIPLSGAHPSSMVFRGLGTLPYGTGGVINPTRWMKDITEALPRVPV